MITSLYRDYFQKSKVFLYPILETKRGGSVTPINTYVSWDTNILKEDRWLICTFYLRNDFDYRKFEKNVLLGNSMFRDFKEAEEGIGIYIFSFEKHAADWEMFLQGKYSKLSLSAKEKIRRFYSSNNANAVYVDSFLNPKKYYPIYADLLGVKIEDLEGGQLCSHPDFEKETLKMLTKDVSVPDKSLDLPQS